jgi:hypothetical protein
MSDSTTVESCPSAPGSVSGAIVPRRPAGSGTYVLELDPPLGPLEVDGGRLVDDGHRCVEDLEDPLEADQRAHEVDPGVGQARQRLVDAPGVGRHRHERPDLDAPGDDHLAADAVDHRGAEGGDDAQGHEEDPPVHGRPDAHVPHLRRPGGEVAVLVLGPAEELHEGWRRPR